MATENEFLEVLKAFPDDAMTRFGLGSLYRDEGRFSEAAEQFRKATDIDPAYSAAWLELGLVLENLGSLEESKRAYEKAASLGREKGDEYVFKRAEKYLERLNAKDS